MLKMMKMDFNTRVGSFCVDTKEEIAKLPTLNTPGQDNLNTVYCAGMGSECLVISDASVYILNGENKWVEFGGSGGSSVLDFLPYPDGIYGYWDYEHGVKTTTWTDMVNGNVLTCNAGGSFSVVNDTIQIVGDSNATTKVGANLDLSNDFFVIYFICPTVTSVTTRYVVSFTQPVSNSNNFAGVGVSKSTIRTFTGQTSVRDFNHSFEGPALFAHIKTPNTIQVITKDAAAPIITMASGVVVPDNIGLSFDNQIKGILLSTETNNVDNIQANLRALEEKYFPAQ